MDRVLGSVTTTIINFFILFARKNWIDSTELETVKDIDINIIAGMIFLTFGFAFLNLILVSIRSPGKRP